MSKIGRSLKKLIKHKKPEICMAAGVIFGAAAVVTACVQTKKGLDKVVDDHNARIKKARALPDDDPKNGGLFVSEAYREAELGEMDALSVMAGYNVCLCHIPVFAPSEESPQYTAFKKILDGFSTHFSNE